MYYQILETAPPAGFQMPMGQWRVRTVERIVGGVPQVGFRVTTVSEGAPSPGFVNILPGGVANTVNTTYNAYFGGTFYLGNWQEIELPLTGGGSVRAVVAAGSIVTGLGILAAFVFVLYKKRTGMVNARYSRSL